MSEQNYTKHKQYYIPHHLVFYPVILALTAFCIRKAIVNEGQQSLWIVLGLMVVLIGWLSFMVRQHYAMTLQNRIIISELRYRYFVITGRRFEDLEHQLSDPQLFALRFAGDDELELLAKKAIEEKLSSDDIKKSIRSWKADKRRV